MARCDDVFVVGRTGEEEVEREGEPGRREGRELGEVKKEGKELGVEGREKKDGGEEGGIRFGGRHGWNGADSNPKVQTSNVHTQMSTSIFRSGYAGQGREEGERAAHMNAMEKDS